MIPVTHRDGSAIYVYRDNAEGETQAVEVSDSKTLPDEHLTTLLQRTNGDKND